ncbi:hypothetical protein ALC60_05098 [Trachymyrmex zeteki]|uniref:CCHC-type domain-containing protein n=1 Tax=Mycetomoellerius zeteki TaxID=64791 RepID=A0A151X6P1_9HYME|nr:hypothetical protein ALC60_05098 [Trachymyrmex zeteki]
MTRIAKNKITEIKSSGRNKVAVYFNDFVIANQVLSHPLIKESGLSASIPPFRVIRTGVIKNVPLDISEDDIIYHFASPNKIVSVRRLNIRTLTYLHINFPVLPYFPRVLMCFSCLRYGHVSSDCKSKPRCARCGSHKYPKVEDCPRLHLPPVCCNCGGEHLPSSSGCPAYVRQKQIYAYATIENLSYLEARQRLATSSPFASPSPPNLFHHSDFPALPKPPPPPHPSRSPPRYDDPVASHAVGASFIAPDTRLFPGRSYADTASSISSHKPSDSPQIFASRSYPPSSIPRAPPCVDVGSVRAPAHRPTNAYAKIRESHNALLYSPNGRPPNYVNPPTPLLFPNNPTAPSDPLPPSSSSLSTTPPSLLTSAPNSLQYGISQIIQIIVSLLFQMLNNNPEVPPNSNLSTGLYNILNALQALTNTQ